MHAWAGYTKHQETNNTLSNLTGTLFASEGIGLKCGGSGTDRISLFLFAFDFFCPISLQPMQCVCVCVCGFSFSFSPRKRRVGKERQKEEAKERVKETRRQVNLSNMYSTGEQRYAPNHSHVYTQATQSCKQLAWFGLEGLLASLTRTLARAMCVSWK